MVDTNPKKKLDAVVCHECAQYFTPSGLHMHTGSEKCRLAKIAKPMSESAQAEFDRMKQKGKHPVVKNVALALQRRRLESISGLEKAPTKLMHSDIDCVIIDQYWVEGWVYNLWKKHNKIGYTRAAYSMLEGLNKLSLEDRESKIGLILLNMYG